MLFITNTPLGDIISNEIKTNSFTASKSQLVAAPLEVIIIIIIKTFNTVIKSCIAHLYDKFVYNFLWKMNINDPKPKAITFQKPCKIKLDSE